MTTRRTDPEWLAAQYNNRARVPEHGAVIAGWQEASARARATLPCELDIAYGDSPTERLDVFMPGESAIRGSAPVLLFIHGGWWRALDKADHSFVATDLAPRGALVVVPNYALCPAVGIDTIALQMAQAVAWTWRHARRFGGDPSRLVVAGHSAGGHLAAMLLCARWPEVAPDLPPGLLSRALSVSGVFDLEPIRRTPFLQPDLRLTPEAVRRLSPAGFAPPAGQLLAVAGALESDEFLRHNQLIRRRWGAARVPVCEAIAGRNHFNVINALAEPGSRLNHLAAGLLGL
jgi:arylformamidase